MPMQTKHRSCYFCGKTQGVNAATRYHGQHTIFVSKDLATCSHVFLRTDTLRKGLQPPYGGLYKNVDRTKKVFRILRHGKEVSVRIDRLKPAYIPNELEDISVEADVKKQVSLQPEEVPDSGQENPKESSSRRETTTRSSRRVRFNPTSTAKTLAITSGGGLPVAVVECFRRDRTLVGEVNQQSPERRSEEKRRRREVK
ncbi:retrovirus-related Pol polyprotein from transposon 412 [Trichonephila clavata]|uniref:Retrovirus-related Pol polyprotein from transposon 412 n=1 Tax=Trichonephila clavata TaxID=2740835 RepID=A0A8X6I2D0_TRICU|nr:retrovirus-related Pol polyprotein from transposon 412 [Trichonephila clavata]